MQHPVERGEEDEMEILKREILEQLNTTILKAITEHLVPVSLVIQSPQFGSSDTTEETNYSHGIDTSRPGSGTTGRHFCKVCKPHPQSPPNKAKQ